MEVSMRTLRRFLVGPLLLVTAISTSAFGQDRHAVNSVALAAAVDQHAARQNADREAIRKTLDLRQVREMAVRAGVDVQRLSSAVDTLTGTDLARAAAAARSVDQSLVGGANTITLQTTTIIIGLLVLILIIVAVS
jgi:hypothetical protein